MTLPLFLSSLTPVFSWQLSTQQYCKMVHFPFPLRQPYSHLAMPHQHYLRYFLFDYNKTIQFSCLHFMVMLYVEVLELALSVSITLLHWCLHYFSALFSPYTPLSSQ